MAANLARRGRRRTGCPSCSRSTSAPAALRTRGGGHPGGAHPDPQGGGRGPPSRARQRGRGGGGAAPGRGAGGRRGRAARDRGRAATRCSRPAQPGRGRGPRRRRGRRRRAAPGGRAARLRRSRPATTWSSATPPGASTWRRPRASRARASPTCWGRWCALQLALVGLAMDILEAEGFTPVVPPVLVREEAMCGTGFFPTDRASIYRDGRGRPVPGGHLRGAAGGPSRRPDPGRGRPAPALRGASPPASGARPARPGKDTRGIFRVHQFDKVEMFSFVLPEDSPAGAPAHPGRAGADPPGDRGPVPGRGHRRGRPRRAGGAEVRLRGLAAGAGRLPRADLLLQLHRLPGPPPAHAACAARARPPRCSTR